MIKGARKHPGENNKEYSYRVIKDKIMSLELKPGQAISEVELAEALHISRTPIREVIGKLREEHLVEVYPQVGSYVSKNNPRLLEEAAFMRYTLEREVMKTACLSFPKEQLRELRRNIVLQEESVADKSEVIDFHKLDTQFHKILFQGIGKEHVWEAITRLSTHYNRVRVLAEMEYSYHKAFTEHKIILRIIENKEIDQVEQVLYNHIMKPTELWEQFYKPESPYISYFDLSNQVHVH
ncbi:GntR family transcriptional regulator [Bacillus benzoevorans]|uniref:DNA-binding GntR family transcriptional regulator n=1 Tax=Bacillus benzoevorans TaxID=1456 RepID=A0A7X0HWN2_9BACI|nr:GntR family transcriptional regulator [Bacillus benzoevorans]MBB6446990.1 DNA-binding GntR family transcriptional regulator [Bacillus benzoevorans]